jgi:hypothetical protein
MHNFSTYATTHNTAIDQCANIIALCRKRNEPLKALHLRPIYYEWFKSGVQTLMDRPLEDGELMQFDGVDIEKATNLQSKNIVLEYYPINIK